jgi:hypothetical protein
MSQAFLPCFLCALGTASHRITLPSAGTRWICTPCNPGQPGEALAPRMADGLLMAARLRGLDLHSFRRCCEALHDLRYYGADIVDHVEAASAQARARLGAGELLELQAPASFLRAAA